ncbi:MAG: FtsW/RodA/SpoVE family cell cycle protein [Deinococcus sp.]
MRYDLRFPVLILALLIVGLMTVSTAALAPRVSPDIFQKQLIGVGLSLLPIGVMIWAGRDRLYKAGPALYILALLLQASTFVIGKDVNGQQNWIVLGPVQFQPLEFLKYSLVLFLPLIMREGYRGLRSYFLPLLAFLPALGMVVVQDFGGAMILAAMFLAVLLVWKMPLWHVLLLLLAVGVAFPTVVFPRLKPYQQTRLTGFVNPYQDGKGGRGSGYQVIQSTIAIGSGGMMGKGYLKGTQSHNGFLPEAHNDFAFATWAEEQGLVGALAVLLLYAGLVWGLANMA